VHQYVVGYKGGQAGFVKRADELAAKYGERFTAPDSLR
jgi:3-hydroxyacyl-CoA dehydrogenase / enoyl-CoA hydratase / 3-hydroxybutyryl-CoA epimerase